MWDFVQGLHLLRLMTCGVTAAFFLLTIKDLQHLYEHCSKHYSGKTIVLEHNLKENSN